MSKTTHPYSQAIAAVAAVGLAALDPRFTPRVGAEPVGDPTTEP